MAATPARTAAGTVAARDDPSALVTVADGRRRGWNEHRAQRRAALVADGIVAVDKTEGRA